MPEEIAVIGVCEHMHWTYEQYMAQPQWFLDVLTVKMVEDAAHQRSKSK